MFQATPCPTDQHQHQQQQQLHLQSLQINQIRRLARPHAPQQDNHVTTLTRLPNLLAKLEQPPALDVENTQFLLLASAPVIHVLHLQRLGRHVEHPPHRPLLVVEELARRILGLGRVRRRLHVQVYPLVLRHAGLALGAALQRVEFGLRRRCTRTRRALD